MERRSAREHVPNLPFIEILIFVGVLSFTLDFVEAKLAIGFVGGFKSLGGVVSLVC